MSGSAPAGSVSRVTRPKDRRRRAIVAPEAGTGARRIQASPAGRTCTHGRDASQGSRRYDGQASRIQGKDQECSVLRRKWTGSHEEESRPWEEGLHFRFGCFRTTWQWWRGSASEGTETQRTGREEEAKTRRWA